MSSSPDAKTTPQQVINTCKDDFTKLGLKELMDSPADYEGKRVEVTGYYNAGTEESAIANSIVEKDRKKWFG